jgi:hypothetical protein
MAAARLGIRDQVEPLLVANIAFVAAVALHTSDHLRQARGVGAVPPAVLAGGTLIVIMAVTTLVLTLRRHRAAALAATVVGFATAIGVTASHVLPTWSILSDSYLELALDGYSWAAALTEILAGAVLGFVALRSR